MSGLLSFFQAARAMYGYSGHHAYCDQATKPMAACTCGWRVARDEFLKEMSALKTKYDLNESPLSPDEGESERFKSV